MRRSAFFCLVAGTLVLGACGEKVQTTPVGGERKSAGNNWSSSDSVYRAPGWTAGDRASWEKHLATRAQAQNDFAAAK